MNSINFFGFNLRLRVAVSSSVVGPSKKNKNSHFLKNSQPRGGGGGAGGFGMVSQGFEL